MPRKKIERKDLIRHSLEVFQEKGYHKTTISDIASACGLLKGSIYHYVESKEALMVEVLETLKDHYVNKVFSLAYDDNFQPEDRLRMLAIKSEEIFLEERNGNFFVNIGLETKNTVDEFQGIIREFFEQWIRSLTYLFSFKLPEHEARINAEVVVAEVEGAAMLTSLLDDDQYLKRTNQKIIELFGTWRKPKKNKVSKNKARSTQ